MSEPTSTRDERKRTRFLPGADRPLRSDPLVWTSLLVAAVVATVLAASIGTGAETTGAIEGAGPAEGACLAFGTSWCLADPPTWVLWLFALAVFTPFVLLVLGSVRAYVRGYRGT
jgi:hypothetical protein